MLDRKAVEDKMKERGFTIQALMGNTKIIFISEHAYDMTYEDRTLPSQRIPVINITVYLDTAEFECCYCIKKSITTLNSPKCSPVMNDEHFDNIVTKFESEAKCLEKALRRMGMI